MEKLLPDRLKLLWEGIDIGQTTVEIAQTVQEQLLDDYRAMWTEALVSDGHGDLKQSLLSELARYLGWDDLNKVEFRCRGILEELRADWQRIVKQMDRASIEQFYDLFELIWWHTLIDDRTPLAYVLALDFARRHPGRRYLDFGAGIGSGALLFARHGFDVALADISSPLLQFAEWRLRRRGVRGQILDLKRVDLPANAFELITTMDVFEHLADPLESVDRVAAALTPGGYIFGRFAADQDVERPQHIVFDFEPTFRRLADFGFTEVWRDEWLWGHQVFQKPS